MNDLWSTLEAHTRTWNALARQGVADAIWRDYVSLRFGHTGDPRALEYLYPYLNHADRPTRLDAIEVAARIFEGRGPRVLAHLDYFTHHPDPFLRDRAVRVAGAAVHGARDRVVLEALAPYLDHRNRFIRRLALIELGQATAGQASPRVLAEIQRVAQQGGPPEDEVVLAIARACAGGPTEEVYRLVARPDLVDGSATGDPFAVAVLVRGAADEWYGRACREVFEPRLHMGEHRHRRFIRFGGIVALCHAAAGRGMEPLRRLLHLRGERCEGHALSGLAPTCFAGADVAANRTPLIELAQTGDVQAQRIAAVCLGRLTAGTDDAEAVTVLKELCHAKHPAVQAAALRGLGMAAVSSCDEEVRALCLARATRDETAVAAIRALGMIFSGAGRADVFAQIRDLAEQYRQRPVRGRKHCRPLAACYLATGDLYRGTGADAPVPFLLDVLALPRVPHHRAYQWSAAKALSATGFSRTTFGKSVIPPGLADSASYAAYAWIERAIADWGVF